MVASSAGHVQRCLPSFTMCEAMRPSGHEPCSAHSTPTGSPPSIGPKLSEFSSPALAFQGFQKDHPAPAPSQAPPCPLEQTQDVRVEDRKDVIISSKQCAKCCAKNWGPSEEWDRCGHSEVRLTPRYLVPSQT